MFVTLQIMFSKFKNKHYRIKLLVMRILINLKFLKFVVVKRNKMSLRVLSQLIKYVSCFAIRRIDLHVKRSILIVIL